MNWGPVLQQLITTAETLGIKDGLPIIQDVIALIAQKGPDELSTDAGRQEILNVIKAAAVNASNDVVQALSGLLLAVIQASVQPQQPQQPPAQ